MPLDKEMLLRGSALAEGDLPQNPVGIESMLLENPEFANIRPAGSLPQPGLNIDSVLGISDEENAQIDAAIAGQDDQQVGQIFNQAGVGPETYLRAASEMPEGTEEAVEAAVNTLLQKADEGDEEAGLKAVAAAGLSETDRGLPEIAEDYRQFDDMIEAGGLQAVQQFVRSYLAPEKSETSVPEWALPMTVFGITLQSEPGDWRQAILRAQAKTSAYMFNKRLTEEHKVKELEAAIQVKALDIYTKYQEDKRLSAKELADLVGKGELTPASISAFMKSGDPADLQVIDAEDLTADDITKLLDDFTISSVAKFEETGDITKLERLGTKIDPPALIDLLKEFIPSSVNAYVKSNPPDTSVLVRKPAASDLPSLEDKIELLELGFTGESIDKAVKSGSVSDLVMGEGGPVGGPDYGTSAEGVMRSQLESISNKVKTLKEKPEDIRIRALRTYVNSYGGLTESKTETDQLGNRTTQTKTPQGFKTPAEMVAALGLNLESDEVAVLIRENEKALRMYPREELSQYLSLVQTSNDLANITTMLNDPQLAPQLTGVSSEILKSAPYRIFSDLVPSVEIPKEITLWKAIQKVLQTNLVREVLQEKSRFSDQDRQIVREFIEAESFPDLTSLQLALKRTKEVLDRNRLLYERDIQSGVYTGTPDISPKASLEDRQALIEKLLQASRKVE